MHRQVRVSAGLAAEAQGCGDGGPGQGPLAGRRGQEHVIFRAGHGDQVGGVRQSAIPKGRRRSFPAQELAQDVALVEDHRQRREDRDEPG